MRKIYIIGIIIIAATLLVYSYITWPRHIQIELKGIEYSQEDKNYSKKILIQIDGTMKKKLNGNRTFIGNFTLDNSTLAFADEKFILSFDVTNSASLSVSYGEGLNDYGDMFANEDMSEIVIFTSTNKSEDGHILAVPAEDRETAENLALKYTNKEYEFYFKNN